MKQFIPLFKAIIAFVAVLTGLGLVFNLLLSPVKMGQVRLEKRMDRIEKKLDKLIESKLVHN
ncbi:MAG: hypothetical protein OXM55_05675 [Bdellovibrionales bacterium]|nr:hypothetical protein [Bdellovibrionales bacterium]